MNILVTGGAGYIGSITCVQLIAAGFRPVILDSLVNAKAAVLDRIEQVSGQRPRFIAADVRDRARVLQVLREHAIDAVIHFAGLKAVGESVAQPLRYYDNNVQGSLVLIDAMREVGVKTLVFSSSATVYGDPQKVPITEASPLCAVNPYGRTKLICEDMLRELQVAEPDWQIAILRYFNPVGAHPSGLIGEQPRGVPNNLMPYITQVALGQRSHLSIFGDDYPTPDGTGVRDYIHVLDLALGHLAALQALQSRGQSLTVNLGTGRGVSVRELVNTFAQVNGLNVPSRVVPRRPGDAATCYADTTLAHQLLGWQARLDVARMCEDAWRWQSLNPQGYD